MLLNSSKDLSSEVLKREIENKSKRNLPLSVTISRSKLVEKPPPTLWAFNLKMLIRLSISSVMFYKTLFSTRTKLKLKRKLSTTMPSMLKTINKVLPLKISITLLTEITTWVNLLTVSEKTSTTLRKKMFKITSRLTTLVPTSLLLLPVMLTLKLSSLLPTKLSALLLKRTSQFSFPTPKSLTSLPLIWLLETMKCTT